MPIGVVKNQADEKHWDKAKSIVQEEHLKLGPISFINIQWVFIKK